MKQLNMISRKEIVELFETFAGSDQLLKSKSYSKS